MSIQLITMDKLIYCLLLFCFLACNDTSDSKAAVVVDPPAATVVEQPLRELYPTLPQAQAERFFQETDYMDYVFYELPFSMNHSKEVDIKNAIRYISTSPVTNRIPQCKSIGRIFYQAKGEIIGEAEFHFNNEVGCYYLIFMEEGKPKYANLLTTSGVNNYSNLFAQVNK